MLCTVSILLINSKKGLDIFDKLKDNLDCLKAEIKYGLQHNLQQPTKINPNSVNFYNIYKNKGYKKALYKHTFPGKKVLLKRIIKDYEGEVWCISKHLLAASYRLMEVGTKALGRGNKEESKEFFNKVFFGTCR